MWIFFFTNFHDSVIVGIDVYNKVLIHFFSDIFFDFGRPDGFEGQFVRLLGKNLINNIGNDFRIVQVDQTRRR